MTYKVIYTYSSKTFYTLNDVSFISAISLAAKTKGWLDFCYKSSFDLCDEKVNTILYVELEKLDCIDWYKGQTNIIGRYRLFKLRINDTVKYANVAVISLITS